MSRVGIHLLHTGAAQCDGPGGSSDDWLSSLSDGSGTVLNDETDVLVDWHQCYIVIKYPIIFPFLLLNKRKSMVYLPFHPSNRMIDA